MLFNYDWWFSGGYLDQVNEAKRRCARLRFPDAKPEATDETPACREFYDGLEARTVLYLRDGFSYEVKTLVPKSDTVCLTFECMPADEAYKVGCFVVRVPYDDIVRVEVYAVHQSEKPEDMPAIKGFAGVQPASGPPAKRPDDRPVGREREAPVESVPSPSVGSERTAP